MIYLASPYSHTDEDVRELRFHHACAAAARLMRQGRSVFSPIAHSHPIERWMRSIRPTSFWLEIDRRFFDVCSELIVLKIPGWDQSLGVAAEIEEFARAGKPVSYMEPAF